MNAANVLSTLHSALEDVGLVDEPLCTDVVRLLAAQRSADTHNLNAHNPNWIPEVMQACGAACAHRALRSVLGRLAGKLIDVYECVTLANSTCNVVGCSNLAVLIDMRALETSFCLFFANYLPQCSLEQKELYLDLGLLCKLKLCESGACGARELAIASLTKIWERLMCSRAKLARLNQHFSVSASLASYTGNAVHSNRLGDRFNELTWLSLAISVRPSHVEALQLRCLCYRQLGKSLSATADALDVTLYTPLCAESWSILGSCYRAGGFMDLGAVCCQQACVLDPDRAVEVVVPATPADGGCALWLQMLQSLGPVDETLPASGYSETLANLVRAVAKEHNSYSCMNARFMLFPLLRLSYAMNRKDGRLPYGRQSRTSMWMPTKCWRLSFYASNVLQTSTKMMRHIVTVTDCASGLLLSYQVVLGQPTADALLSAVWQAMFAPLDGSAIAKIHCLSVAYRCHDEYDRLKEAMLSYGVATMLETPGENLAYELYSPSGLSKLENDQEQSTHGMEESPTLKSGQHPHKGLEPASLSAGQDVSRKFSDQDVLFDDLVRQGVIVVGDQIQDYNSSNHANCERIDPSLAVFHFDSKLTVDSATSFQEPMVCWHNTCCNKSNFVEQWLQVV